jgi:hypothetical protein
VPRLADSIYSKRSEQSKTACQRKPMAPLARSSTERFPKEPFARLPTALRPSRLVQQWVFYQAEKELTSLPVLRYDSGHRKRWFKNTIHACGILKKGDLEAGKWPADPYYYPLYEEANRLDLPICVHIGSGTPDFVPAREFSLGSFMRSQLPTVHAFHTIIRHQLPVKYPKLRFGIIEAGCSWIPFIAWELKRRMEKADDGAGTFSQFARYTLSSDLLKANRMYVTCQVDEDLPYILKVAGEDSLMFGSDYTHRDSSMEYEFPRLLKERADAGEISQTAVQKILYDNAKTFYGL